MAFEGALEGAPGGLLVDVSPAVGRCAWLPPCCGPCQAGPGWVALRGTSR